VSPSCSGSGTETTTRMSLSRALIMLSVLLGISGSVHYYFWARLVRDTKLPPPWNRILAIALVVLAVLSVSWILLVRFVPRDIGAPALWLTFTWFGVMFFLFVLLVPADLIRVLTGLGMRVGGSAADPARREFMSRVMGTVVGVGAFGLSGMAAYTGLRSVAIKKVPVVLARLPRALSGYRIVQMTDIHVGPTIGQTFIEELVQKSNALDPDMVVITGDLVDGRVSELGKFCEPLRKLRSRDGVYFVTGNHEYYSGVDEWIAFLQTVGIRVLRNERVSIRGQGGFDLAGIDDFRAGDFGNGHGPDLSKALTGRDPSRSLVLLAHQPKAVVEAAENNVDLQLSGHTHGGQLFPFNYLVALEQPFVAGLHRKKDTQVYVSCGTGYWGPPMRLGIPAEITEIELRSA
jgi:predicted MPP superfamily phosphohydrolase